MVAFERFKSMTPAQVGCVLNAFSDILHSCVGIDGAVSTPGRLVANHLEKLRRKLGRSPVVWLFGGGRHTTRLLGERYLWESQGIPLTGIIDDHPRFKDVGAYLGLPLRSKAAMEQALKDGESVDGIILSTDTLQELFWERTTTFRTSGVDTANCFNKAVPPPQHPPTPTPPVTPFEKSREGL